MRFISMMLLALVLVIGVCGGVGAAATKTTQPVHDTRINTLEKKISELETELRAVRDEQLKQNGQMWYERAKLQLDHTKEWVGTEQKNIEQWYESLTHFTTIGGILVGLFGIGITFFSYNTARKQRIDAEKAKKDLDKEIEDFQKEAGTKKEALEAEQIAIADKQIKIRELLDKLEEKEKELNDLIALKSKEISDHVVHCEKMADICNANVGKTNDAAAEAFDIVENLHEEMTKSSEKEKAAVKKAAETEPKNMFKSLKAKALAHELNEEWKQALQIWQTIEQESPEHTENNFKVGYLYHEMFNQESDQDIKSEYFEKSSHYYREAIIEDPKALPVWNNWGTLLANRARQTTGEEKVELWNKAEEKFKKATDVNPELSEPWNNWAVLLADRAKQTTGEEKEELWDKAEEKYKTATDVQPDYPKGWYNWASLLASKAKQTTGQERVELWDKAEEKYKKATDIKPEYSAAWNNWASLLASKAAVDPQNIDASLLKQAKVKALRAEEITEGFGAYNLACITSLQNNFDECKQWLIKSKEIGTHFVDCNHLKTDTDLENLRKHPDSKDWFNDFVEQVCQEEQEAAAREAEQDETDSE